MNECLFFTVHSKKHENYYLRIHDCAHTDLKVYTFLDWQYAEMFALVCVMKISIFHSQLNITYITQVYCSTMVFLFENKRLLPDKGLSLNALFNDSTVTSGLEPLFVFCFFNLRPV